MTTLREYFLIILFLLAIIVAAYHHYGHALTRLNESTAHTITQPRITIER